MYRFNNKYIIHIIYITNTHYYIHTNIPINNKYKYKCLTSQLNLPMFTLILKTY